MLTLLIGIPTVAAPQLDITKSSYLDDREGSSFREIWSRGQCITGMPEHPFVDTEFQIVVGL